MKNFLKILIPIILSLLISIPAFAGDGSGGGSNVAFDLVKSSISNGSENVKLDEIIQLTFNKNVVNGTDTTLNGVSPRDNNRKNIYLLDSSGNRVYIKLYFPDDQIQSTDDYKRNIFVVPGNNLQSNTSYTLIITDKFGAKNGTFIARGYSIKFTTGINIGATNSLFNSIGVGNMYKFDIDNFDYSKPVTTSTPITTQVVTAETTQTTKKTNYEYTTATSIDETTTIKNVNEIEETSSAVTKPLKETIKNDIPISTVTKDNDVLKMELVFLSPWVIIVLGRCIFQKKINNIKYN